MEFKREDYIYLRYLEDDFEKYNREYLYELNRLR